MYLDNSATTQVSKEVFEEMKPYFTEEFGNPSTLYKIGRESKKALDQARQRVADAINAKPEEIIFTGGGSESDNLAIKGIAFKFLNQGKHIITTEFEHPAVKETLQFLESLDFKVTYLPVYENGVIKSCDDLCATGENEKCLTCNTEYNICNTCNVGYYLPSDASDKSVCQKCTIANCKECVEQSNQETCTLCNEGYFTNYDNGAIIKSCDEPCETGEGSKCLTCNTVQNICESCYDGFFIPTDANNKKECSKCMLGNCKKCSGTQDNNRCTECNDDTVPVYDNEVIEACNNSCETGSGDKCLTCDSSQTQCASCNEGFK